jgi:hypothetical protein
MSRIILSTIATTLLLAAVAVAQDAKPAEATSTSGMTAKVEICTQVTNRECSGGAATFPASVGQLYCWSEVSGGSAEMTIKHVWSHAGKVVLEVPLTIKGNRWRTWSNKNILPHMTGEWEVKVVDASGNAIGASKFTIQ